ncbi:enoyl-CoA hydratase/isomerase family protein [Rhodoferax sp. UBA5149]|uniref:enoyl-CoA hydratase/isomerase family protein n=1 Tax=Rhodoferax sp. UBA5149 TaxID=1947379 RepID=UPI0025F0B6D8|nr:enoyl-CoA hydratase-related protein [Rhodoferax sp. UBA5149]
MNFEALHVEQTGAVLHITLNRLASRNAMSLRMVAELRSALETAETGGSVRVVVLRGAGGHFCAGADLKDVAAARLRAMQNEPPVSEAGVSLDAVAQANLQFGELCVAYAKTPLALVAILEGSVMGGGLGLTCVADVALACESAVFRLPETALGVVPAQIAPFLVERLGYSQAKRLAVTGGRLNAANALAIGLVHAVHAPDQMDTALTAVLADILACAPGAVAATKALMAKARLTEPSSLMQEAAVIFSRAVQGPEGLEGTTAFLQKRKPNWALQ